jgi:DNA helicase-2/ATP-dependent DNA helicase PcrA
LVKEFESNLDAKSLKLALAYKDYEKRCQDEGLLDFDSLIFQMVELLDKKPEVRARWKRDWLQLDESQDMSRIEWDLAKLVSGKSVLAVGDISQGIYGFRGSDPKLFASMNDSFPGTKTLFLSCNYRSTPEIIDFIRPIASSRELAEKFHTDNVSGPVPVVKGFVNPADEALWVVSQIKGGLSV